MAENVTLTLHEPDQERLTKLAEIRKDKAVWEHQRTYEQSKREYLGDDVLKDTGSAVVWWLAKNDNHIEKTVADLGLLAQLTSAANDADIPERLQDLIPTSRETSTPAEREPTASDHFDAFLTGMGFTSGDDRRGMLTKQIADIIRTQDKHETADELLRRYDPPAAFTSHADDQPEEPEHPR
ncbi:MULTISPECIES: hypothetical protein [Streptomyces]|nr:MULTISPECIES: hypothetical protein [Streptomyces]